MKNFKYILTFVVGAAVGTVVGCRCTAAKYEKILEEEIDSVKATFAKRTQELEEKEEELVKTQYDSVIEKAGYDTVEKENKEVNDRMEIVPYFISVDEFGELDDYSQVTLFYYKDGVLADELDNIIEDVDDVIGEDALEYFEECEDNVAFIRNENNKTDYEILLSDREYSEIV